MPTRRPNPAWSRLKSNMPAILWPPLSVGPHAVLSTLLRELEETQWLPPDEITRRQFHQLVDLARHAHKHSKFFKARLARARLKPDDLSSPDGLRRLPPLGRRDIQAAKDDLFCDRVPEGHEPLAESRTSGSTGEPVVVRRTAVSQMDWLAMAMREHFWAERDFSGGLAAVRANIPVHKELPDWGPPASLLFDTGPSLGIPITTDIARQYELLAGFKPDSLLVYPSILDGLVQYCRANGVSLPSLRHIRSIGETLNPQVRDEAAEFFSVHLADCYSSQEVGYIALQCPVSGLYHVMAETMIVEVLDEAGAPSRDGEVGRVVITDLHNFATPLVRYDIGDYAEASAPCPCGRGLPTLARILGRERNLILMPDGSRHWPLTGGRHLRDVLPQIRQYQLVQLDRDRMEARLAVSSPLTETDERLVRERVQKSLGHPFEIAFVYFDGKIPVGKNGKFEEFISRAI